MRSGRTERKKEGRKRKKKEESRKKKKKKRKGGKRGVMSKKQRGPVPTTHEEYAKRERERERERERAILRFVFLPTFNFGEKALTGIKVVAVGSCVVATPCGLDTLGSVEIMPLVQFLGGLDQLAAAE